ncbi:g8135 [Coccomyxa viridis]|uniref:G8135 protein n=1 Tax=Coccomyxa viridis TaxID=1274662 RepID=A0ABP1G6C3_9CHLO
MYSTFQSRNEAQYPLQPQRKWDDIGPLHLSGVDNCIALFNKIARRNRQRPYNTGDPAPVLGFWEDEEEADPGGGDDDDDDGDVPPGTPWYPDADGTEISYPYLRSLPSGSMRSYLSTHSRGPTSASMRSHLSTVMDTEAGDHDDNPMLGPRLSESSDVEEATVFEDPPPVDHLPSSSYVPPAPAPPPLPMPEKGIRRKMENRSAMSVGAKTALDGAEHMDEAMRHIRAAVNMDDPAEPAIPARDSAAEEARRLAEAEAINAQRAADNAANAERLEELIARDFPEEFQPLDIGVGPPPGLPPPPRHDLDPPDWFVHRHLPPLLPRVERELVVWAPQQARKPSSDAEPSRPPTPRSRDPTPRRRRALKAEKKPTIAKKKPAKALPAARTPRAATPRAATKRKTISYYKGSKAREDLELPAAKVRRLTIERAAERARKQAASGIRRIQWPNLSTS